MQAQAAFAATGDEEVLRRKAVRDAKAVRGEMHNVLALMRRFDRTFQIPPASSAILNSFKILHDHMQTVSTLDSIPAATYLKPFLDAVADCIASEDGGCYVVSGGAEYYTAMEIAVHALASVNKFVLYGILNPSSRGVSVAMQRISQTISCCVLCPSEADETDKKEKKLILLFKLLELTVCCLRSEVGRFLSDDSVWDLFQTCFRIKLLEDISETLRHTAENTLAHVVLTIFRRAEELYADSQVPPGASTTVHHSPTSESQQELSSQNQQHTEGRVAHLQHTSQNRDLPALTTPPGGYGVPVLCKVLSFLIALMSPTEHEDTRILGLSLINIVLEMGGEALAMVQPLVELMQADLCKFLLQNSQTSDLTVLSLTLRVVYNLFNSIKMHLKVQLEVFLTSVHLRIADSTNTHALPEQKELALESLLDFCQEQSLMYDLYINYDCDIQGTNLFENLCKCLCRVVTGNLRPAVNGGPSSDTDQVHDGHQPSQEIAAGGTRRRQRSGGALGVLEMLALDGLLAVVASLSRRVRRAADGTVEPQQPRSPPGPSSRGMAAQGSGSSKPTNSQVSDSDPVASQPPYTSSTPGGTPRSTKHLASSDSTPIASPHNTGGGGGGGGGGAIAPSTSLDHQSTATFSRSRSLSTAAGMSPAAVAAIALTPEEIYQRKQHKKKVLRVVAAFNAKPKTFLSVAHENGLLLPPPTTDSKVAGCDEDRSNVEVPVCTEQPSEREQIELTQVPPAKETEAELGASTAQVDEERETDAAPPSANTDASGITEVLAIDEKPSNDKFPACPVEVAKFFRSAPGVDAAVLGDWISEPGDRKPFNAAVLHAFCGTFDFANTFFVDALREFLESFRLPGEAQKIDRCMEAFAQVYFEANPPPNSPFANSDACFVLAFSTVMLNTDQHNPTLTRRMKVEDFVRNNKGINDNGDLPLNFQKEVFTAINQREIKVGAGFGDTDALAEQWDGVVKRSQSQAGNAFASSQLADGEVTRRYEKEMFMCIADDMAKVFLDVFYNTRRNDLVLKMLHALFEYATVAAHFGLVDQVNHVVVKLCAFFQRHASELSRLPLGYDLGLDIAVAEEAEDFEEDLPFGSSLSQVLGEEGLAANASDRGSAHQRGDSIQHSVQSRSILALQLVFRLARTLGNQLRAAWRNIIVVLVQLLHMGLLPPQLYFDVSKGPGARIAQASAEGASSVDPVRSGRTGANRAGLDSDLDDSDDEVPATLPSAANGKSSNDKRERSGIWGWLGWSSTSKSDDTEEELSRQRNPSHPGQLMEDDQREQFAGQAAMKSAIQSFRPDEVFERSTAFDTDALEQLLMAILASRAAKTIGNSASGRSGAGASSGSGVHGNAPNLGQTARSSSTATAFTKLDSAWVLCTRILAIVSGANAHRVSMVWPPLQLNLRQLFESSRFLLDQSVGSTDLAFSSAGGTNHVSSARASEDATLDLAHAFPELRWVKLGTQLLMDFVLQTFLGGAPSDSGSKTVESEQHHASNGQAKVAMLPLKRYPRQYSVKAVDEQRTLQALQLLRDTFIPRSETSLGHAAQVTVDFCARTVIGSLHAVLCRLGSLSAAGSVSLASQHSIRHCVIFLIRDMVAAVSGLQPHVGLLANALSEGEQLRLNPRQRRRQRSARLPLRRLWAILDQGLRPHLFGFDPDELQAILGIFTMIFRYVACGVGKAAADKQASARFSSLFRTYFDRLKNGPGDEDNQSLPLVLHSQTELLPLISPSSSDESSTSKLLPHHQYLLRLFCTLVGCVQMLLRNYDRPGEGRAAMYLNALVSLVGEGIVKTANRSESVPETAAVQSLYLRSIFENVLFRLVDETAEAPEQLRLRVFSLLSTATLHHIEVIRSMHRPSFQAIWLKLVGRFANALQIQKRTGSASARSSSPAFREAVEETLKNLVLVMLTSGVFADVMRRTGEDITLSTWSVLDTLVPSMRSSIAAAGVDVSARPSLPRSEPSKTAQPSVDTSNGQAVSEIQSQPQPVDAAQTPQSHGSSDVSVAAHPRVERLTASLVLGSRVEARFNGESIFYPGRIALANDDGTFDVAYDDGDHERHVPSSLIRLLLPRESKTSRSSNTGSEPPIPHATSADPSPVLVTEDNTSTTSPPLGVRTTLDAQSAALQEF